MGSVNKQVILGNLGRDPDLRYLENGQAVCSFSVATSEKWTDKQGEKQERVEWHEVQAWGKRGEVAAQYLSKGRQVYVEGRTETNEYTDKEGVLRRVKRVTADVIVFIGGQGQGEPPRRDVPPRQSEQDPAF